MTIQHQFEKMTRKGIFPIFEIPVIDKRTNDDGYIIFDVSIRNNEIIAMHESLNLEEENSEKIAYKKVEIDEDFDLQHHLEELQDEIWHAINDSEFFKHREEN